MDRRTLLRALVVSVPIGSGAARGLAAGRPKARVRPGEAGWPSEASWAQLARAVEGRLVVVRSPLDACTASPSGAACAELFRRLKNPYFLGDEVGLTQSLGWIGAWTSRPSAHAVAARTTADVVAAVDFAREHNLRLVVKGGGHSYHGTSNAADSLLIWMRGMTGIVQHDAFVGAGCAGRAEPVPAVSVEAGAIWREVYDAVTTRGGRYAQGGGCLTVGVAGLVQSGGFGSFSKAWGLAAASLLEAEIVTADGVVRTANACREPELFWALKGGGGGSLGVVTRLTLRTHELPQTVGAVFATIAARSDDAFRRLIGKVVEFYAEALFNPQWGEQIAVRPGNALALSMVFQGMGQAEAEAVWRPFFDWVVGAPQDFAIAAGPKILAVPARHFWDPEMLKQVPGVVLADDRPGAPEANIFWASNLDEAGQVLYAYQSAWLPAALLGREWRQALTDALFAASRHWGVSLHVNKGLAGAPAAALAAARETAMNPAALDAFALAISGAGGPPAYPGIPGHEPDRNAARQKAAAVGAAMGELRGLLAKLGVPIGSYVAESDFFEPSWQQCHWGRNYPRLLAAKDRYDPDGLFFVHHGVGSERWSTDGFTRSG